MADIFQAAISVLSAIIVLILGQIFIWFFIKPLHEFKKLIGEIAEVLIYYSDKITDPPPNTNTSSVKVDEDAKRKDDKIRIEAKETLRQKAGLLYAKMHMMNGYSFFEELRVVPEKKSCKDAHSKLIGLSNSLFVMKPRENYEYMKEIFDLLKIKYFKEF